MAITLVNNIGTGDPVLTLSAPPNSPFIKLDNEQLRVDSVTQPVRNAVGDGNSGQGYQAGGVACQVTRAWNGTDRAPHIAGATASPLFEVLTLTPGTLA